MGFWGKSRKDDDFDGADDFFGDAAWQEPSYNDWSPREPNDWPGDFAPSYDTVPPAPPAPDMAQLVATVTERAARLEAENAELRAMLAEAQARAKQPGASLEQYRALEARNRQLSNEIISLALEKLTVEISLVNKKSENSRLRDELSEVTMCLKPRIWQLEDGLDQHRRALAERDAIIAEVTASRDRYQANGKKLLAEVRELRDHAEAIRNFAGGWKAISKATHPDRAAPEDRAAREEIFKLMQIIFNGR
ncbi:MAG: hypothetical protein JO204_13060 [Alphaproteobacteria bacterium]|nr:hypothetical protein [Alphaproteobacteria bacterium]